MAIVRWDPFRELNHVHDRLNRLFATEAWGGRGSDDVLARGAWMPLVDIFENDKQEIVLKAELPEMKREDIELVIDNNTLTLRGERKLVHDVKEEQFHRVERSYGSFSRSFTLPNTVDAAGVKADYKDGVLTVTLPRREETKPKQIQVQIAS